MAEEVEEQEQGLRSQLWKHEAMVEWINENDGVDLDTLSAAEVIAYAFARRVAWRQSDTYRKLVASHKAEAEAEKAERKAERKAKAEAEAKAKAKEKPKTGKGTKKAAKKATKATKKTAGGEDPFD